MFSGIIEELGVVQGIARRGTLAELRIQGARASEGTRVGDSISVNGVCLTVTKIEGAVLFFDAVAETLRCSTLGSLKTTDKVNLERSLRVGDRVGGHFVTGHVDCAGTIRSIRRFGNNMECEITFPASYIRNVHLKGSITVDGISLTIAKVRSNTLTVCIIPHTLANTTLEFKHYGDKVNLEFDILTRGRG